MANPIMRGTLVNGAITAVGIYAGYRLGKSRAKKTKTAHTLTDKTIQDLNNTFREELAKDLAYEVLRNKVDELNA